MTEDSQEAHPHHPGRDSKGRWLKGYCGNPNGRPKKPTPLDKSDPLLFGNTLIQVNRNGKTVEVTRREALRTKAFEDAMNGKVTQQRYLLKEMEEAAQARFAAIETLKDLLEKWEDNPKRFSDADLSKLYRLAQQLDISDHDSPELKRKKRRRRKSGDD